MFARYVALAVLIVGLLLGGPPVRAQDARDPTPSPGKAVPAKGMFLVAGRGMPDPRFRGTVLLLVRHDSRGTLGVVVNRPTLLSLAHLRPDLAGPERTVYYGGPVSPDVLLFLVRSESLPARTERVIDNVYAGGSRATLKELLAAGKGGDRLRVYSGHAGWAVGQLQAELDRGDWHLSPADPRAVFSSDPDALWPGLIDTLDPEGLMVRGGQWLPLLPGKWNYRCCPIDALSPRDLGIPLKGVPRSQREKGPTALQLYGRFMSWVSQPVEKVVAVTGLQQTNTCFNGTAV